MIHLESNLNQTRQKIRDIQETLDWDFHDLTRREIRDFRVSLKVLQEEESKLEIEFSILYKIRTRELQILELNNEILILKGN